MTSSPDVEHRLCTV